MKDCHSGMIYLQFCLRLAAWHDLLEVCTIQKLFAMQNLLRPAVLSFTPSNSSTKGNISMGGCQHQVHLLSLHGSCLPRIKTLMKHPFPWSQPASPCLLSPPRQRAKPSLMILQS